MLAMGEDFDSRAFCGCPLLCLAGLCETTLQAEAAARRAAILVYDDAELMVELIAEEELQAAFGTAVAGKQAKGLSRQQAQENCHALCVLFSAQRPGQQGPYTADQGGPHVAAAG
jgi:hypothetical protein